MSHPRFRPSLTPRPCTRSPFGFVSLLLTTSLLAAYPLAGQSDPTDWAELTVSGAVDIPTQAVTTSLISAVPVGDGMCQLRIEVSVEGDAGIGLQVMLPRGLGPGTYRVGPTTQDAGMWDDEVASPGIFTATAALDRAYDPPERRLFGFWSVEGTVWVEYFDGEHLEAAFSVELQERTVRSATPPPYWIDVEGRIVQDVGKDVFSGIPGSGSGGFYLCEVGPAQSPNPVSG